MESKHWVFIFENEFYWVYRLYPEVLTEKQARAAMRRERQIKRLPRNTYVNTYENEFPDSSPAKYQPAPDPYLNAYA